MQHPAIVVDEQRRSAEHPRRMPVVMGRPLHFTVDGVTLLVPDAGAHGSLEVDAGGRALLHAGRSEELRVGDRFHVHRHPYRLDAGDDLVVDARRVGDYVAFNCWHAADGDVRWRGFGVDDPARTLGDVLLRRGLPSPAPSTAGMPLTAVVAATVAQGAAMEKAVAAALVRPLLDARGRALTARDVIATWDGPALVADVRPRRRRPTLTAAAYDAYRALVSLPALGDVDVDDLEATPVAPASAVAEVVRALFPQAWAIERAVREQAGMLDVDSL